MAKRKRSIAIADMSLPQLRKERKVVATLRREAKTGRMREKHERKLEEIITALGQWHVEVIIRRLHVREVELVKKAKTRKHKLLIEREFKERERNIRLRRAKRIEPEDLTAQQLREWYTLQLSPGKQN